MDNKNYIEENKKTFLDLVNSISKDRLSDTNKERLISWLETKSDFFVAPASTKYHGSYDGGLCLHSLDVYYTLKKLVEIFIPKKNRYNDDTIKIVGLFHNISKANFYEKYSKNIKDSSGKWISVEEYKVRDPSNRFIFGSSEQTSEFMIGNFIDLTIDEQVAILHHLGGQGFDSTQTDMSIIWNNYPLALLLHEADLTSSYILEGSQKNEQ